MTPRANAQPIRVEPAQPLELRGRRVHFVGIGGCGMSGLARIVRGLGGICTGSDMSESSVTEALQRDGIGVSLQQTAQSVPGDCELVVASAAVKPEHPEIVEARRRGIPVLKYAQLLGRLMLGRTGVAIAGTHGKSTTTAMLAHALIASGQDPTFIVGATCEQIGGGSRAGRKDMLIAEACEYDRSFHNFHPTVSVVLNVEEDHLDIYGTLDAVVESFNHFAKLTPANGMLLIGHESAHRTAVTAGVGSEIRTIGFAPEADYVISAEVTNGSQRVTLRRRDGSRKRDQRSRLYEEPLTEFDLHMPGEHMAYNAAVAAAVAIHLGADARKVGEALSGFRGLDRRMQYLGEVRGVKVVDDYGHHPTEIHATLRALRRHYLQTSTVKSRASSPPSPKGGGRLICVFQPHQHSRTRFLMEQFAASFSEADVVIVPHIYFVRDSEADQRAVSATDLVQRLQQRGVEAMHIDGFEEIVDWLRAHAAAGDLLVVMGAGPVWKVAHGFIERS